MLRKILILGAFSLVTTVGHSALAQATSYYFVSVCGIPNPRDCPSGPSPVWFGTFASFPECNVARSIWALGYWGMWPRTLSDCIPQ